MTGISVNKANPAFGLPKKAPKKKTAGTQDRTGARSVSKSKLSKSLTKVGMREGFASKKTSLAKTAALLKGKIRNPVVAKAFATQHAHLAQSMDAKLDAEAAARPTSLPIEQRRIPKKQRKMTEAQKMLLDPSGVDPNRPDTRPKKGKTFLSDDQMLGLAESVNQTEDDVMMEKRERQAQRDAQAEEREKVLEERRAAKQEKLAAIKERLAAKKAKKAAKEDQWVRDQSDRLAKDTDARRREAAKGKGKGKGKGPGKKVSFS